ncbi:hypothetical protein D3C71_1374360 [compost metagenome]
MRALARRELRQRGALALHTHRALLHRHAGAGRVQADVETGTGDSHAALGGVDHERPATVMGDGEHHLTRHQPDMPLAGAESDLHLRAAVELKVRTIRQFDLAAFVEGGLQAALVIQLLVVPAAPAQAQRQCGHAGGKGLAHEAPTWQLAYRGRLAQRFQALARDEVGGLPQAGELLVLITVPCIAFQPGVQLRLQPGIARRILHPGEPRGRLIADGIGTVLFHRKGLLTHHADTSRCSRRCRSVRIIYFSTMFLLNPMRSAISAWVRPSSFCQMNTCRQLSGSSARARSTLSASSRACT